MTKMTKPFTAVQMIGTQRSGSNLLRLMLHQLDEVSAPHAPHILERFTPLLPHYEPLSLEENFARLTDDVCKLIELNPVPWEGIKWDRGEVIDACRRPLLEEILRAAYERKAAADGARIWVCKSLVNYRFAERLDSAAKPKYIYLYRDGRDVAASFRKAIVGEKHVYHIAAQWRDEQHECARLVRRLGERAVQISYESLLENTVAELERICSFIGAPYRDKALHYYRSAESINTARSGQMWANVEQPMLRSNTKKYKNEMSEEDIRLFEKVAGHALLSLGYELDYDKPQDDISPAQIEEYARLNEEMKREFRGKASPSDLDKRRPQDEFLQSLKANLRA